MDDNRELIKQIMENGALPEFVNINDDALVASEKEEIISEALTTPDGSPLGLKNKKIDLVKMAFLYIQGWDGKSIAKAFDTDEAVISKLKSSPKFKAVLTTLNAEIVSTARTFLAASGMKAVITLIKCMDSRDDKTKLRASTEVLDRIGIRTPEQIELIQKSDRISGMDEQQLMEFIKLGMKELPQNVEGSNGKQEIKRLSEG